MSYKREIEGALLDSYKPGPFNRAFWLSLSVIVVISIVDLSGGGLLASLYQRFSGGIATLVPQINNVAATRDDPIGIRNVLATVVALTPFQYAYFVATLPEAFRNDLESGVSPLKKIWQAAWVSCVFIGFVILTLYFVLPAPSAHSSGRYVEVFGPLFGVPVFAGSFWFFWVYLFVLASSALTVWLGLVVGDWLFGKRGNM